LVIFAFQAKGEMARREADLERRLLAVHLRGLRVNTAAGSGAEFLQGLAFNLKLPDVCTIRP
jgi:hypothetical protein